MQNALAEFTRERDWAQFHKPRSLVLALVGEVGELAAEFQWLADECVEQALQDPEKRAAIGSELADVLSYILRLADVANFDLEDEFQKKMNLNSERYPADKAKGSAAKYTAYE
jgi:dCTP diphosphatase